MSADTLVGLGLIAATVLVLTLPSGRTRARQWDAIRRALCAT